MALLTCHFFSQTLNSNIAINLIYPTPQGNEEITGGKQYSYMQKLPVVYLLHGAYGDSNSWIRFSNVERYAQQRRIAVVMASAENSFYQDLPLGLKYATFFTQELPVFVRNLLPVSDRREDTFIAGFSMGGYGAWHIALLAPEVFSKAASLSGALDLAALCRQSWDEPGIFPWRALVSSPEELEGSQSDLFAQYEACARKGLVPALLQTCGTEDFLYGMNVAARDRMRALGAEVTYVEGPGGHDWDFWDSHIAQILDWMLAGRGQ